MAKQLRARPYITPLWMIGGLTAWDILMLLWMAFLPAAPWERWTLTPLAAAGMVVCACIWVKRRATIRYWRQQLEYEDQLAALARLIHGGRS